MPSGSHTASGNVATLKPVVAGTNDGGKNYVVVIQVTVDGTNTERRKLLVKILKAKAEE
jgi:ribosome recycling factor